MITAVDIARRLADTLERAQIDYAIGGALAMGYYAPPRATLDVDINIFVPPATGLDGLLQVLRSAGFEADDPANLGRTAREDGQFRGRIDGVRVDVFVPAFDFYAELGQRRRQVVLLGRPLYILGPEDLLVLKMMFFRRKDLADAEAILRGGKVSDLAWIRDTLYAMVGADDPRITEWDQLVLETRSG